MLDELAPRVIKDEGRVRIPEFLEPSRFRIRHKTDSVSMLHELPDPRAAVAVRRIHPDHSPPRLFESVVGFREESAAGYPWNASVGCCHVDVECHTELLKDLRWSETLIRFSHHNCPV